MMLFILEAWCIHLLRWLHAVLSSSICCTPTMQAVCSLNERVFRASISLERPGLDTNRFAAVRTLVFPHDFQRLLFASLAARSDYFKSQIELVAEEDGPLRLPVEMATLWLRCIFLTPDDLHSSAHSQLVEYLAAAEFFQDTYMITLLYYALGKRAFKSQEASNQHGSAPVKVLEGLSDDQVIEVLRSAPGTFEEQLIQLPSSVKPLVVLVHCSGLAAVCQPADECADSVSELPLLTVCVDTSQALAELGAVPDTHPEIAHDPQAGLALEVAGAQMWPRAAQVTQGNVDNGLFSLQQRAGSVACCLLVKAGTIQNQVVQLPRGTSLVLGPASGHHHLKNITFEGGAVVCMGSGCRATFEDVVFQNCSLVMVCGAQATLSNPHFHDKAFPSSHLSIYVHGAATKVTMQGGTISGGVQGAAVQAGGQLKASNLTITEVQTIGVHVMDEGSSVHLSACSMHGFTPLCGDCLGWQFGVFARMHRSAHTSDVSITGLHRGVNVQSQATAALLGCNVSGAEESCVCFRSAATGNLDCCTLSGSLHLHGLDVHDIGSHVVAARCNFIGNGMSGVYVSIGGKVAADACSSSSNREAGFHVQAGDSVLDLTDCTSAGDVCGCKASHSGNLTAERVVITSSDQTGVLACMYGYTVLRECTVAKCKQDGCAAHGRGRLEIEGCTLKDNEGCGALAQGEGTVMEVKDFWRGWLRGWQGSCSSGNAVGYKADQGAHMVVSNSSSDGQSACVVTRGGHLNMKKVTVDGVVRSGPLA